MFIDTKNYRRQPWVFFGRSPGIYPSVSPDARLLAFGVPERLIVRAREDGGFEKHWVTPGRRGLLTSWSPDNGCWRWPGSATTTWASGCWI